MTTPHLILVFVVLAGLALAGCLGNTSKTPATPAAPDIPAPLPTWDQFAANAGPFDDLLTLPRFEQNPDQMLAAIDRVMADTDEQLERFAAQDLDRLTFAGAIAALDDITYPAGVAAARMGLMKQTQPLPEMRQAATDQVRRMQEWFVALQYREDLYKICKAFADQYQQGNAPRLDGEDLMLFQETMRDYRRAGMHLDADTRTRVEDLKKQLADLSTDFSTNITNESVTVAYTRNELEGLTDDMLELYDQGDGSYALHATVTHEFITVMENARHEAARKKMKIARYQAAQEANIDLLNRIVALRDQIKDLLGYETWADYRTETRMAKSRQQVHEFLGDLAQRLQPGFDAELERMREIKADQTGDPQAKICIWDWRYYRKQILKRDFDIDPEAVRDYFPYHACLRGMFDIYQQIFGLKFTRLAPEQAWHDDVTLHGVSDAATGEPLGMFYLDMFPRSGKFNHFAQFGIIGGKRLADGRYQRPVVTLVCNFTPPTDEKPSLLSHNEVETLFHEFGHALHSLLTRAKYASFSGTHVPRDFVEAPSQMLEAWVWDPQVLNAFAGHYQDPSRKIDPQLLARMKEAKLATIATHYRRQLALATGDLRLHSAGEDKDAQKIVNQSLAEIFLAPPEGTAMAAYWGHMTGYDAGYYGYAWADSIAADMESIFQQAPDGLMSKEIGMKLRNEIYAVGGAREINDSIEAFLGRPRSNHAFLKSLGVASD